MPNNKYSIKVSIKAFLASWKNVMRSSENDQLVALENALVAMIRNIYGSNILLVSHFEDITEYKNAVTSNNIFIVVQLLYK